MVSALLFLPIFSSPRTQAPNPCALPSNHSVPLSNQPLSKCNNRSSVRASTSRQSKGLFFSVPLSAAPSQCPAASASVPRRWAPASGPFRVPASSGDTESKDAFDSSAGEIILEITGMMCDGCVASVTRILESQPLVSSAKVNLQTATAVVFTTPDAQLMQNWQKDLGEKLANHLTNCGFKSNLRG